MRKLPSKFQVRETLLDDAAAIMEDLRSYEKKSVELTNLNPVFILHKEINDSLYCFTGLVEGRPAVIWGIKPPSLTSDVAYLWAITTTLVDEYPFVFARHSQEFIKLVSDKFPKLTGYVQNENERSKRWLKWLGFKIAPPVSYNSQFLCRFERRA